MPIKNHGSRPVTPHSSGALHIGKNLMPLGLIMLATGCTPNRAPANTLVRDHRPVGAIVVDKDASPQIRKAARTLQTYIAKSTGATLPIRDAAGSDNALHVGKTSFVASSKMNLTGLDEDGFVLRKIDGHNFAIVGGSDWGTEFGVYDFLERYLGVRWLMPTALGEDVPRHDSIELPDADVREAPVYLSRRLSPLDIESSDPLGLWARQNRARGRIEFHHNLLRLFPPSKYAKTHPEFYATIDDKRYLPSDDVDPHWQPNFSAPGIADAAVEEIVRYFQANPDAPSYSLGMNDSLNFDQSPASKARRSGRKNYLGQEDVSDDYFQWANEVVERVLQQHPGKLFGTLAYHNIADPPTRVPVNPAIVPFLTYERMRWTDPELRRSGHELTKRWAAAAPSVGWYDYAYGISYQLPRVWFHQMQEYLSWGAANGVNHYYAELYPNFGSGPKSWVLTKLLWDPSQNVDTLLDDWYRHAAGAAAAPKLREYFAIWENFWTKDIQTSKWNRKTGQWLDFAGSPNYLNDVPPSYLTRSTQLLEDALSLADTPERKARVAKLAEMWRFYRASVVAYQAISQPTTNIESEQQALEYLDSSIKILDTAAQRSALLDRFQNDPLYGIVHQYVTRYPGTRGADWGKGVLWKLLPWVARSQQVNDRLKTLARQKDGALANEVSLLLRAANGGTQILRNDHFDEGLTGWTIWDKANESSEFHRGTFTPSKKTGSAGSQLHIQGLSRGSLMQTIPYGPGSYYATVTYSTPQPVENAYGTLTLQILDEANKTLRLKNIVLPAVNIPFGANQGGTVTVPFQLPEEVPNAKNLRVMLLIDGLGSDKSVYIHNISVYRID